MYDRIYRMYHTNIFNHKEWNTEPEKIAEEIYLRSIYKNRESEGLAYGLRSKMISELYLHPIQNDFESEGLK